MEELLNFLLEHSAVKNKAQLLLISPAEVKLRGYQEEEKFNLISRDLGRYYRALSEKYDIHFADAAEWGIDIAYDGVHFSEEGHIKFAQKMGQVLNEVFYE